MIPSDVLALTLYVVIGLIILGAAKRVAFVGGRVFFLIIVGVVLLAAINPIAARQTVVSLALVLQKLFHNLCYVLFGN